MRRLPADAFIGGLSEPVTAHAYEVHERLTIAQTRTDIAKLRARLGDHDEIRVSDDVVDRRPHQSRDVRQVALQCRTIRTGQPLGIDVVVEDADVVASPDERLD